MTQGNSKTATAPQLLVGLGNPGQKYEKTRHNIGFEVVDALASAWQLSWRVNPRFHGQFAEGRSPHGQKVFLLKPLTYMNRSGQAVRAVTDWYKLPPPSVLAIYDDLDLPLGRLRLRLSGSAGGHNGMKSLIAHLGSQNFPRLRIGIGKSNQKTETIAHVLSHFAPQEIFIMAEVIQLAVEAVEKGLQEGLEKAMSLYNNRAIAG